MRIGCFASTKKNAYVRLFYKALEAHGIERVQLEIDSLFDSRRLAELPREVDAIYLHWIESLWRRPGSFFPWRLRSIPNTLTLIRLGRALAYLQKRGVRILWTVHNLDPHEQDTVVDLLGRRLLARVSDLRVCHSSHARNQLLDRYGGAEQKTVVMYHGNFGEVYRNGLDRATALGRMGLREDQHVLLCFGNIRDYKGIDLAIRAMRDLGDRYQLIVAGHPLSDEIGANLQSLAADAGNVRFDLRFIPEEEIGPLFSASDCVLLPYRRITGSGALLAALTQGKGVVASDLPYFRELLAFGPEAGTLHAPEDAPALAAAVREFFSVPPELRSDAAIRLSSRFEWETVIQPLAERIWLTVAPENVPIKGRI